MMIARVLGRLLISGVFGFSLTSSANAQAQGATSKPGKAEITHPSGSASFDATSSLTNALRALGRNGGTLEITTPGTYYIASPIVLDQSTALRIECAVGASRAAADNQAINIVYTGQQGSLFTAHAVRSLEIGHCNLAYSNSGYNGDLIDLSGQQGAGDTTEVYIHDSRIGGLSTAGAKANSLIRIAHSNQIVIERNYFLNANTAILGPSDTIIAANLISIRRNYFAGPFGDVAIRAGGTAWTIAENVFEPKAPDTCGALNTTTVGVMGLSFRGNWIGDGHLGTCVAVTGPIQGGEFSGNDIEGAVIGISLGKSTGVSIAGNHLEILKVGIEAGAATDVNIVANSFSYIPTADKVHSPAH